MEAALELIRLRRGSVRLRSVLLGKVPAPNLYKQLTRNLFLP
jgi:hypothetical protein